MSFARINYRGDTGTAATPILTLNGLTVSASCSAGPTLAISATTAVDGALLHWAVNQLGTPPNSVALYDEEDPFNTGISEPIADDNGGTSGAPDSTQGTLTYARPDGGIVTATFMAEEEEDQLGGTADCFVIGHAQSSS